MSTETDSHTTPDSSPAQVLGRVDEAIYALDTDWQFRFVNEQAAEMLDRDPDELLGVSVWEAFPATTETSAYDEFHDAMETGEPTRFDMHYERWDAWFAVRAYPDPDGLTVCFYDVTEERGRELELERKRRLFEAVFEDTEDTLVIADTDRQVTDFNPAAERLFGYDAADVIGEKSVFLYADESDYERQGEARFNEGASERHDSYVVEYERADGTTFEGETVSTPLEGPDGETLAFLGAIRDVSARIEYEQRMAARNETLRQFHDITTDADRTFTERLTAVLELGRDHLDLDVGLLAEIDGDDYTVEAAVGPDDGPETGATLDLGDTFCDLVVGQNAVVGFDSAAAGGVTDHPAYSTQELESYLGVPVVVDGNMYGTLNFSRSTPRPTPFTESEETFARLLAQWVGKELSRRRQRSRAQANRDRLRQIIDMLPQLVYAKDEAGEFLLANEAVADAYGTTVDNLEGATDADFADSREEVEQFRADDRAVIESGEPKHIPEESLTTADGERRILETTKIPYDPVDVDGDAVLGVSTDITEVKEREAELEVQSAAMEASMDGISILNEDNEYIYMNQAHAAIFEYDADELLGNTWRRLYGDNEIARIEQDVFPVLEREGEWRGETVGQRRDGTPVHQEITLSMLEDGKLICTNRDITERKRREQELERKTTQLEAILQNTTTPMFLKDRDGEYLLSNREYRDVFGFEEGDVVGQTNHDLHPEAMADEVQQNDRLVLDRGESVEIEERIPATEEERIYITTKSPIYGLDAETSDDSPDAVFGVANDITERKEREQKLRELKERLDLAVEGANLGVWDWDMQTDDVTFNEQWATMLGLSLDEIELTLETWEKRVHPADMNRVEAALEAHIAAETDLYDCEHRMQTASGDWKWIRDIGEVVERDDDGEPVRAVGIHLDITDQKETQTSLEEERDMFAEGPAVVFKWENEDGWPVEYVSDNVTETFGYTPTELETGEVPYTDLIKADDLDRVAAEVEDNSDETTERFSHDPYRMVTANGDVKWVKDHTKIIRNEDEITHYLGYLIDITERKRLEQSIRESEQSIREVTQIAADTERDFQSKLDAILDLGCERLALPYGFLNRIDEDTQHVVEATGTHPLLQPGESAPLSKAYCRKTVQQDGVLDVTDAVKEGWGDDSAYETFGLGCYIGGQIVVDGETYGTLCFADDDSREHDFDETEQAFVELLVQWLSYELESDAVETKLRQLNETAQRMLAAEDHDEVGTIAIESAKSVLDMPVTGVWWYDEGDDTLVPAGMTDDATDVIDRQPRFQGEDSLAWQVFVDGEARLYDDLHAVEGLHNDGTDLRSEVIVPLGDHGVLLSGSTQQRAFSETDRSLLEVLSATVEAALSRAEREQELRKTRERLAQSNQELEQFAYAASHDLQEPLRTVSSYLTLLERRYSEDLSGDALEFVDIAVDGADRMQEMIQALLKYSRVETRGDAFEPTDVSTVFDQVTRNLERTIDEAGTTVDVPDDAGMVVGDESQLVQLFQNLVENGIKYSENQPSVEVSVTHRDGAIEYAVADDGIGMEPDQIDGIFEVFQRLHTREEFSGTGIGLSVCRKIVDRHDGDIRVESTPGKGSTFFITLPVEADTRA